MLSLPIDENRFVCWFKIPFRSVMGGDLRLVLLQVSDCGRNKMLLPIDKNRQHKFLSKSSDQIAQSDFFY
jgi:hypothetical protein